STVMERQSSMPSIGQSEREEKESRNLISGLQDTVESKLLQDEGRRMVKEEWIGDANSIYTLRMSKKEVTRNNRKKEWILLRGKENEPVVKRIIEKRKCKVLTENWRMVEDTNSLGKSLGKSLQYLERQEESEVLRVRNDMLEEMVRPEAPISKGEEHIAEDVVIEDIDVGMIRQQKVGREMEETLEQQLQSNRE
ncbi:9232_t:CDS:2, partial [Gigaspora rosea]